ncbi:MAG: guanylate kinase [Actinomycetota bacterium]|nr:guanylate kinase [Actinomycetota bacterium]
MLFVLCGPGGVGKGTVSSRLVEQIESLDLSRSWTTRGRREGEDSDAYVFASREAFEKKIAEDGFLEYAEFLGNFYGTPVPDDRYLAGERDLLLEIEVQGASQVKDRFPESVIILLLPPSMEELERRLIGRGDSPEHVERRLSVAREEILAARSLGATDFVNVDVEETVSLISSFISERHTG